jgi:hypothetical protein
VTVVDGPLVWFAIAAEDERILPEPPFSVVVDSLGESGVRFLILPTVRPAHYLAVRNDLRERIKARFDAEGIEFAVPRREVHLRRPAAHRAPPAYPGTVPGRIVGQVRAARRAGDWDDRLCDRSDLNRSPTYEA